MENHELIREAQLLATGATAHQLNQLIQKYYNAAFVADSFPECRLYQHEAREAENTLREAVRNQREFHNRCEQARAAAAS